MLQSMGLQRVGHDFTTEQVVKGSTNPMVTGTANSWPSSPRD